MFLFCITGHHPAEGGGLLSQTGGSQEEGAGRVAHDATECGIIWADSHRPVEFLIVLQEKFWFKQASILIYTPFSFSQCLHFSVFETFLMISCYKYVVFK